MNENQKIAEALLETCRAKLSGNEILTCEKILQGEDFLELISEDQPKGPQEWHYQESPRFKNLQIQFSEEIGNWLNGY